ncbi:MAG: sulfatase [Verrucomicrobiales bacterium]|nr:sulfatase [Verrucomicrobiales bacterium]
MMNFRISLLLFLGYFFPVTAFPAERPNILFIMADDLGYGDLSCYGAEDLNTPNIDQLAEEGVLFTDFYANAPTCTPTRAGFLTGRYQQRLGLDNALTYQEMGRGLQVGAPNIARDLQQKGYVTGLCGKWHLGYDEGRTPLDQGFDHFFGLLGGNHHYFQHMDRIGVPDLWMGRESVKSDTYTTDLITDCAKKFIRENQKAPFFLYLSHAAPHFPFQGPEDRDKVVVPKKKSWQIGDRETYIAMVERMDEGIGEVLAELDQLNLRKNTLVVFTSDNGGDVHARNAPFSGGKSTLEEGGIRVPCIARWPGQLPEGKTLQASAVTMDWSATFRRLAGIEADSTREDGIDLMPLLTNNDSSLQDRALFWRRKSGPKRKVKNPGRAVRRGNWKYIENFDETGETLLFDLKTDPGEKTNLLEKYPGLAGELRKELDQWETDVAYP